MFVIPDPWARTEVQVLAVDHQRLLRDDERAAVAGCAFSVGF
jgi:hypothetical protein